MRFAVFPLVLLTFLVTAGAEDEHATPATVTEAAQAAVDAVDDDDQARLRELAARNEPDPWMVAELLCVRERLDVAEAFARAAPRLRVAKLPAYVAAQRENNRALAVDPLLRQTQEAFVGKHWKEVIELAAPDREASATVGDVRIAHMHGRAHRGLRQLDKSSEIMLGAGRRAEALGWLDRARNIYFQAGVDAYRRRLHERAFQAWRARLGVERRFKEKRALAQALGNVGLLHWRVEQYAKAIPFYEEALPLARAVGGESLLATILHNLGVSKRETRRYDEAGRFFAEALAIREKQGNRRAVASVRMALGNLADDLNDFEAAYSHFSVALQVVRQGGHEPAIAGHLSSLARAEVKTGRYAAAREHAEAAVALLRKHGDRSALLRAYWSLGSAHRHLDDLQAAKRCFEHAIELVTPKTSTYYVALLHGQLAGIHEDLGDNEPAREAALISLRRFREIRNPTKASELLVFLSKIAIALGDATEALKWANEAIRELGDAGSTEARTRAVTNLARVLGAAGRVTEAKRRLHEARETAARVRDPVERANLLGNAAVVYSKLGDAANELEVSKEVLELYLRADDVRGATLALGQVCGALTDLGRYAEALRYAERALEAANRLGQPLERAGVLTRIGIIQDEMGRDEIAIERYEEALAIHRKLGSKRGVARAFVNIAGAQRNLGRFQEAAESLAKALSLIDEIGDAGLRATVLHMLAVVARRRGQTDKSDDYLQRAYDQYAALGDTSGEIRTLLSLAISYQMRDQRFEAHAYVDRCLELLDRYPSPSTEVRARWVRVDLHRYDGAVEAAFDEAQIALRLLAHMVRHLADDEGASTRQDYAGIFGAAHTAALTLGDPRKLYWLMEMERASSFREAFGASALIERTLDPKTRSALHHARMKLDKEQRALRQAPEVQRAEARALVAAAQDRMRRASEQVQREARIAADAVLMEPETIRSVQARLASNQVLVLYGQTSASTFALVLGPKTIRRCDLGLTNAVRDLTRSLASGPETLGSEELAQQLRARLRDPLDLGAAVSQVLVSPVGHMAQVPFSLVFPLRTVAYMPSATALTVLSDVPEGPGDAVLAIGAPDVSPGARLPEAGQELHTVGSVVLQGDRATASRLQGALARKSRWRAIHFGCHALVDTEQPGGSHLLLAPDAGHSGRLSALDTLALHVPADLVVLAACDTARGRTYATEGLAGLARAFMFAGAPRIICSLWKVDDAATRFFMEKFYELWNPKDGEAMGAAAALKAAQQHVREHEMDVVDEEASALAGRQVVKRAKPWAHPRYWAAWVLWGLPE